MSHAEVLTDTVLETILVPFGVHFGSRLAPKATTSRPQEPSLGSYQISKRPPPERCQG